MSEFETETEYAPPDDGSDYEPSQELQQAALTVDPFDTDSIASVLEAFRGDLETHVNRRLDELMGPAPVEQAAPPMPEYAAQVQGNIALTDIVNALGEHPEFTHLKGIDAATVVEHARAIAPTVMAFEGETAEAATKALHIAAEHVASVQAGEQTITDEINLRNQMFANGRLDPRMIRYAAETAFARGTTDVGDAIREGFELAGGKTVAPGGNRSLIGFYGAKAKAIRESGLSSHAQAELARRERQAAGSTLQDSALVAKYAKAATDHKVATGKMPRQAFRGFH